MKAIARPCFRAFAPLDALPLHRGDVLLTTMRHNLHDTSPRSDQHRERMLDSAYEGGEPLCGDGAVDYPVISG